MYYEIFVCYRLCNVNRNLIIVYFFLVLVRLLSYFNKFGLERFLSILLNSNFYYFVFFCWMFFWVGGYEVMNFKLL